MADLECSFDSMGTSWHITVWDDIPEPTFRALEQTIRAYCSIFDHTYSRFIKDSFISQLADKTGVQEVPPDFTQILRMYEDLFKASGEKFTPLVGNTLSDMGYDATYSLQRKKSVRPVPHFLKTIAIIDDRHIDITEKVTIDIGAIGKGFAVDALANILELRGVTHYLVDGSGDIRYRGPGPIKVGLEHPLDVKKVIGSIDFSSGAMCGSATNRRSWQGQHHIIDPHTMSSTTDIIAAWVIADTAALADGLSTALFLCTPEQCEKDFSFEYLLLNKDLKVKRSAGFNAELY
ncbi:FAD:protein FMN transferase [Candidatus Woesebacteria bacterium]|nr:FAD:protein FMN transferase [Candidatus Woesebacteria bacterium]